MDNLFKPGREENWRVFFSNDKVMQTQALVMCKTGIVKVDHRDVQKDCTGEELWQRLSQSDKNCC